MASTMQEAASSDCHCACDYSCRPVSAHSQVLMPFKTAMSLKWIMYIVGMVYGLISQLGRQPALMHEVVSSDTPSLL
jgi:hypothetical protein